jgi:RHS repeat-associated protein
MFAGRGYTGHEHLPWFGLVNMNGRLYDPAVGSFLSPDNYIQMPDFTQNYNRYGYALNNPLKYTDPSGESFLLTLLAVWAGNYVIGWLDNVINKDMSPKDAFRNTNFIMGVNFSPADMSKENNYGFSNPQVDAHNEPKKEEETKNKVNSELNDVRQTYGQAWMAASYGEIKAYTPNTWDRWYDRSQTNIISKITYDMADGLWVTAQSFVLGPKSRHINGSEVVGDDRVDAFVNTTEWGLFVGELSSFKAIKGGYQSARWGVRLQSHTHSLNPISGRGFSGSKAVSHLNINKFHIIYNPKNWKGWSTYPYLPFRY